MTDTATASTDALIDSEQVDSLLAGATVDRNDLLKNEPALRLVLDLLRLESARGFLRLIMVVAIPLLIFFAVTSYEGRFGLGSVTHSSEELGSRIVRGMSFVGDTMVWPFVVLIPLLFVLLNKALDRFEDFFEATKNLLSRSWLAKNPTEYSQIVNATRAVVRTEGIWRYTRWAAIAGGLLFFTWNTLSCTFADRFKPYKTNTPYVEYHYTGIYEQEELAYEIPVSKWDTDLREGLWSWLCVRLWVLSIGYVWIPIVIHKLFNLVAATYLYTSRLSLHQRALEVKPLSPDDAGGLSKLASLAITLTYPMAVVGVMLAMQFIKENTSPSPHNILLLIPFAPVFLSFFFLPLLGVHRAMSAAKEKYLQEFADLFDDVQADFLREIRRPSRDLAEFSRLEISMRGLSETYDRIAKMPVWPFEISTLYRLFTVVLIPVLIPLVLDVLARRFLH